MTAFLTGLLSSIIRPIIKEELKELKEWAFTQSKRLDIYEEIDSEAARIIELAQQATTTEEVKAHLRMLKATRASLRYK